MRRVVVVGSGVAGTAAALAAARGGARVHVVAGAPGASSLAGGALDWDDWQTKPTRRSLAVDAEWAFAALDFGSLPDAGVLVATTAGIVRPAAGADHALLDLDRTGRGAILVPRCDHPTWDAPALARAWGDCALASARALSFVALDVPLARYRDERLVGDVEIAARHDDDARLDWLAERLREVLARNPGFVGIVLPPWLGVRRSRAEALSQKVGIRCGEALVGLASASGARFEHARDLALAGAQVEVVAGWAKSIVSASGTWRVVLEEGEPLEADAVVIAAGGLVGGGLVYSPGAAANAAELPPEARPTLRVGVAAPVVLGSRGAAALRPSTLFGAAPESIAWPFATDPWLERAGILVADDGAALDAPSGLFAAGDVAADAPRAWLATFERAALAGAAAGRGAST